MQVWAVGVVQRKAHPAESKVNINKDSNGERRVATAERSHHLS